MSESPVFNIFCLPEFVFRTANRFQKSALIRKLAFIILAFAALPATNLLAQTSADDLYHYVKRAQAALGSGEQADAVRDTLLIRELETESAKGFSADVNVLQDAVNRFQFAEDLSRELKLVQAALGNHLENIQAAGSIDLMSEIAAFSTELELVDVNVLDQSRNQLLAALNALKEYNDEELSSFGRHYINKRLKTRDLTKQLKKFEFQIEDGNVEDQLRKDDESDEDYEKRLEELEATKQNNFNIKINELRREIAAARQRFGLATFSYQQFEMAEAERQISAFEDKLGAYLLFQSRRKARFEEQLAIRKQAFVTQENILVNSNDRLYQAELGRWLHLLNQRGQQPGLDAAARREYSRPNFVVTVQESLINRLASQPISQIEHLDEVIVGSRALGWNYTSGLVSLDFVDSPHSAVIRINLAGSVQSSAYTKEGPVTAYTSSTGNLSASREVIANVGNLTVSSPQATATISSQFQGTDCIPLVTRIASNRFNERQQRAEEIASERARDRVLDQFTTQTDEVLDAGAAQLEQVRSREVDLISLANQLRQDISELLAQDETGELKEPFDLVDTFHLPRVFVTTSDTTMQVGALLEANNRLAANTEPPMPTIPCDVRIQLHESMVSNLIAPVIQDRLIANWQFRNTIESLASGAIELPEEDEDRPFAIRFEDGRPLQIEFDGQEIGLTIFGKEFRQGRNAYDDPLSIKVRARIIRHDGKLKLSRSSNVSTEFTYSAPEDKNWDVTFRSFLQDNLEEAVGDIEQPEDALPLPAELMFFVQFLDDENLKKQLANLKLVEFSSDNGWLTIGWNYAPGNYSGYLTNTPAIWTDLSIYEQAKADEEDAQTDEASEPADGGGDKQPSLDMDDDS